MTEKIQCPKCDNSDTDHISTLEDDKGRVYTCELCDFTWWDNYDPKDDGVNPWPPTPARFYRELISSIQDTDLKKCASLMTYHIGESNAISIDEIGVHLRCEVRKARQILEQLIEDYGVPVCSHSGKAGRWLASTPEEVDTAATERESRAQKLIESARKLRAASLPASVTRVANPIVQQGLF
jgi:hypothetical protein